MERDIEDNRFEIENNQKTITEYDLSTTDLKENQIKLENEIQEKNEIKDENRQKFEENNNLRNEKQESYFEKHLACLSSQVQI